MQQELAMYDYSFIFKIVTILFLLFVLVVGKSEGGLRSVFFSGFSSDSSDSDVTIISFPNICVLLLSGYTFSLFINLLGYSFFSYGGGYGLFLDASVLFVLIMIKLLFVFLSSIVLSEGNLFRVIDKEFLSYMSWMTLICLVLNFVILNYSKGSLQWCIVFIVIVELLWYLRLGIVLIRSTEFNFLYFFSYLCSLEILPTLALAIYVGVI